MTVFNLPRQSNALRRTRWRVASWGDPARQWQAAAGPANRPKLSVLRWCHLGHIFLIITPLTAKSRTLLFAVFDSMLKESGYLSMVGQIFGASLVAVWPKRNTEEDEAIKAGEISEELQDKPAITTATLPSAGGVAASAIRISPERMPRPASAAPATRTG